MRAPNVERCGYGFPSADAIGEFLSARDANFHYGLFADYDTVCVMYSSFGINREDPGAEHSCECPICGPVHTRSGIPDDQEGPAFSSLQCSPTKHAAYYDSFDETSSRLLGGT